MWQAVVKMCTDHNYKHMNEYITISIIHMLSVLLVGDC